MCLQQIPINRTFPKLVRIGSVCACQDAHAASASRGFVISSMARISGFMVRSSMRIPTSFGTPVNTSLHRPRSKDAFAPSMAASSFRSSTTEIRRPASASTRISSRSAVVFPSPGLPRISVLAKPDFKSSRAASAQMPGQALAMRIQSELRLLMPHIFPFSSTPVPQTPMRSPL